jgi:bacteriocin biosynthesis cyclodehydratase domain-containing protein
MLDDFSRVLRFKPHLLVLDAGPDTLFIVDEFRRAVLRGAVYVRIAACLRDRLTIAATMAALSADFSAWQVLAALDHLASRAYVRADPPDDLDAARGFFERTGLDGDVARARLQSTSVAIEAFGVDAASQRRAFAAGGIAVAPHAALTVALVDSYERRELGELAAHVFARGGQLLPVMPEGVQTLIGPLLGAADISDPAHDVPCLHCLRYWIALNRPVQTVLARHHGDAALRARAAHTQASLAATSAGVAAFVEQLAVDDARRDDARRHVLCWRADTLASTSHRVVRRPQCPHCGRPGWMREQAMQPPPLAADTRIASTEGGFRAIRAQTVLQRYRHLVSPVSGAIAYLHPMPGRHAGMRNVYVSGYLVTPPGTPRTNRFDRICSGKGRTDEQARASALCEALERFSGVYQGDEASVRASMNTLCASEPYRDDVPVHVNDLQQFSEHQFDHRDAINALTDDVRKQVPQRFSPDDVVDWTPAWSLPTGKRHWLPLAYCFADTPDSADGLRFCVHNPNGSAAGSSIGEAILQGLFELIERDAVAIWWYNQTPRPAIDLARLRDAWIDALVAEYASLGWRLWALDLTHDLAIPVVVALAEHPGRGRFSIGFGCHLDRRIAIQRALTEVNQLLDVAADSPPPWDAAKLRSSAFLYPAATPPATTAPDPQEADVRDLTDALERVTNTLFARGMDVLVVNKTRPDIGLPVVQVAVPGLCHFWPRFGARRLYAVPVQLGWLERPRREDELNGALLFL